MTGESSKISIKEEEISAARIWNNVKINSIVLLITAVSSVFLYSEYIFRNENWIRCTKFQLKPSSHRFWLLPQDQSFFSFCSVSLIFFLEGRNSTIRVSASSVPTWSNGREMWLSSFINSVEINVFSVQWNFPQRHGFCPWTIN